MRGDRMVFPELTVDEARALCDMARDRVNTTFDRGEPTPATADLMRGVFALAAVIDAEPVRCHCGCEDAIDPTTGVYELCDLATSHYEQEAA